MKTKKAVKEFCQWHEVMETPAECAMKPTVMPQPTHTPTPWRVSENIIEIRTFVKDVLDSRGIPTGVLIEEVDRELSTPNAVAHADANAAFIVCAVNSHEELLEALKEAQKLISTARQYFPKSMRNSDKFSLENTCAAIGNAIAKAEGRE